MSKLENALQRETKLQKRKEKIRQHNKSFSTIYKNAIKNRLYRSKENIEK